MATCIVSGTVQDITSTAVATATVRARVITPFFSTTIQIVPKEVSTTTDSSGNWSLTLIRSSQCIIEIEYPPNTTDSALRYSYAITVPAAATANFSTLVTET